MKYLVIILGVISLFVLAFGAHGRLTALSAEERGEASVLFFIGGVIGAADVLTFLIWKAAT